MQVQVYSVSVRGDRTYVTLRHPGSRSYPTLVFETDEWAKYGEEILREFRGKVKERA